MKGRKLRVLGDARNLTKAKDLTPNSLIDNFQEVNG